MDLVVRTSRQPEMGETIFGHHFDTFVGGKGCNQSIAASRLGAEVTIIGRIGSDVFGDQLLELVRREHIATDHVHRDQHNRTGIASILVDESGDNSIVVVSGANMYLSVVDIDGAADVIRAADVLLLQLEVPVETSLRAADIARDAGCRVILNPAPARDLPERLLGLVDILTPNQSEVTALTGISAIDRPDDAAHALIARGVDTVIVTMGARGALVTQGGSRFTIPAFPVSVVDTTAAGDAFSGALAVALAEGLQRVDAARFANAAGALTCTQLGAAPSLPLRREVDRLLRM